MLVATVVFPVPPFPLAILIIMPDSSLDTGCWLLDTGCWMLNRRFVEFVGLKAHSPMDALQPDNR
ncbi:MAG: hypothetical protein COY47_05030 [Chloroflexi bacterium CG_4_10_14_0_8_um_filter_57_5]|nr:MAG: hypothetical protein COY47_05030 [Chloroflexi bacterium CG_4_10_14_0_8_um_filter_57_5]